MGFIFDLFSLMFQKFCEIKQNYDSRIENDNYYYLYKLKVLCYQNSEFFDSTKKYLNITKQTNISGYETIPFYLRNEETVDINTKFGVLIRPIKEILTSWNDAVVKGYINEVKLFHELPPEYQYDYILSLNLLLNQMCYVGVSPVGSLNIVKKSDILKSKNNSFLSSKGRIYTRKSLFGDCVF